MPDDKDFRTRTYGEARTANGSLMTFSCRPEELGEVKAFLEEKVFHLESATDHPTNVEHGGYGLYSRYRIVQHKYAGGGYPGDGGWIEVLEIVDPPDGRHGIVIHESSSRRGTAWSEWRTVEEAIAAFEGNWSAGQAENAERFPKLPGFLRYVACGALTPWFYAIGEEELVGDYAFPYGLTDDPVFRFGRRFVVTDRDGRTGMKTCMGTRFIKWGPNTGGLDCANARMVYWDDGTVWYERSRFGDPVPVPAEEGELWIAEAMREFQALLAGMKTEFAIRFLDGTRFVGKIARKRDPGKPDAEGKYFLRVNAKGEAKPREGWVDFKPTPENPELIAFLIGRYAKKGVEIERTEVLERHTTRSGKKWAGVFFDRSR